QPAPRDAVADRPRIGAGGDERRARDAGQSSVESLTDGDDLAPTPRLVPALDGLPCAPAVDDPRTVACPQRTRDPAAVARDRRENVFLPGPLSLTQVGLFEHRPSR